MEKSGPGTFFNKINDMLNGIQIFTDRHRCDVFVTLVIEFTDCFHESGFCNLFLFQDHTESLAFEGPGI